MKGSLRLSPGLHLTLHFLSHPWFLLHLNTNETQANPSGSLLSLFQNLDLHIHQPTWHFHLNDSKVVNVAGSRSKQNSWNRPVVARGEGVRREGLEVWD